MGTLGQELRSNLQLLLERRQFHEQEAAAIDQELQVTSDILAAVGGIPQVATAKRLVPTRATGQAALIKEWTFNTIRAAKKPMNIGDIAMEMLKDGYDNTKEPSDFVTDVYVNGVQPLIRDGLVGETGDRQERKYQCIK